MPHTSDYGVGPQNVGLPGTTLAPMANPQDGARMYALKRLAQLQRAGLGLGDERNAMLAQRDPMAAWRMLSARLAAQAHGAGVADPRAFLRQRLIQRRMGQRPMAGSSPMVGPQNSGLPTRGY